MKLIPENHIVADSLELMAGTSADTVADLQVLNDGNTYEIAESGGTPGFDLHLTFKNVIRFSALANKTRYDPGTHFIQVQLWNYVTGTWDNFTSIESSQGFNYRFIDIEDDTPYINNIGETMAAFDHVPGGTASHRMFIDYVALVR